jgi:hypothetical protein
MLSLVSAPILLEQNYLMLIAVVMVLPMTMTARKALR